MKVLFVASECAPFIKTGGLADVVSALPRALADLGSDVRILLPGYPTVLKALKRPREIASFADVLGGPVRLLSAKADGLHLIAADAPDLFGRDGNPYLGPDGADWSDNWRRFGVLSKLGAEVALGRAGAWQPDLVHVHDWQAGLVPAYLRQEDGPPSVVTIHNIAFQGVFAAERGGPLGLPPDGFSLSGYEYYGSISYLKTALAYADRITTVSPTYAREIMTADFGFGLDGILRHRRKVVSGILNGIDLTVWDPSVDPALATTYSARQLGRKAASKTALEARFGLSAAPDRALFCVISRLSPQKGIDLLLAALPRLLSRGGRLAVLGSGDPELELALRKAADDNPGTVGVIIGYDEPLSHLMQGGSDAILIPSRFEPCGLTQLYGLRYGTLPVVARTGGLADTVIDLNAAARDAGCGTGFQFAPPNADTLGDAIERALDLHADRKAWTAAMRRAMKQPVGWESSARAYLDLYRELVA